LKIKISPQRHQVHKEGENQNEISPPQKRGVEMTAFHLVALCLGGEF
jgi:hypothetical protein